MPRQPKVDRTRNARVVLAALGAIPVLAAAQRSVFFDDFQHVDRAALSAAGWNLRSASGHPGVSGAVWRPDAIELVEDPLQPGQRLLRLTARTDGTPAGTTQAQLCLPRKVLAGTYAARVRFSDEPVRGIDGDPVIQTFYAVSPLRFDFDPTFSEIDWEYLPNGGWGSPRTRLYAIAWQTARVEPWSAHNAQREVFGSQAGWRTLVMQVADGHTRWFVDGSEVALHGGRNHPVVPMSIRFNLWFSPTGLLPRSAEPRVWQQDVDWVLHVADRVLSPAEVADEVQALRSRGTGFVDTIPAPQPALPNSCDF